MSKTEIIVLRITPVQKNDLKIYCKGSKQSISSAIRLGIDKIIGDERKQSVNR